MTEPPDSPVYISRRAWRTLGQEYRVYADRLEIGTVLGQVIVRFEDIETIDVRPPPVIGDAFRHKPFRYWFALKMDLADFARHVAIHRKTGAFRNLRISPPDPDRFVEVCREQMARHRPV